jgi:hypothetical protein
MRKIISYIRPLMRELHPCVYGEQPKIKGLVKLNTNGLTALKAQGHSSRGQRPRTRRVGNMRPVRARQKTPRLLLSGLPFQGEGISCLFPRALPSATMAQAVGLGKNPNGIEAVQSFAISNNLAIIPPLPAGEGRGEGELIVHFPRP